LLWSVEDVARTSADVRLRVGATRTAEEDTLTPIFTDRFQAGRALAARLRAYADRPDVLVLGLPRGGVPVAFAVARALDAPLEPLLVRKLGAPGAPELAMGAVASGGARVMNDDIVAELGITNEEIESVARVETEELERRDRLYRGDEPPLELRGKVVIVVDDGLATGATMRVAMRAVATQDPARLVAAAPVGSAEACHELGAYADEVVCAATPEPFHAVGLWYADFEQTSDAEVRALLSRAHEVHPLAA
jgi:putative phosphoribosyl transferase